MIINLELKCWENIIKIKYKVKIYCNYLLIKFWCCLSMVVLEFVYVKRSLWWVKYLWMYIFFDEFLIFSLVVFFFSVFCKLKFKEVKGFFIYIILKCCFFIVNSCYN